VLVDPFGAFVTLVLGHGFPVGSDGWPPVFFGRYDEPRFSTLHTPTAAFAVGVTMGGTAGG